MKIAEFRKISSVDYPGKIASIIFTSSCNFSCPSCHAKHVIYGNDRIKEEEIFSYLNFAKGFIDGLVISGGEPTLQPGLAEFCREFKKRFRGLELKLDTNGSNYIMLAELLKEKLIDYVALDVKGPVRLYKKLTGLNDRFDFRDGIEKAIGVVQNFPDYEFRTTIVPVFKDGKLEWLTGEEGRDMAEWVKGFCAYGTEKIKWYLQPFVARSKEEMVDEKFSLENLPKEMQRTPAQLLEDMCKKIKKYFPNVEIR